MGRLSGDAPCARDCPSSGKLSREAGAYRMCEVRREPDGFMRGAGLMMSYSRGRRHVEPGMSEIRGVARIEKGLKMGVEMGVGSWEMEFALALALERKWALEWIRGTGAGWQCLGCITKAAGSSVGL